MDAQALCDAAVLGDADGIRLCLGMHEEREHDGGVAKLNDSAGKAWFYALFSRLPDVPRITAVKEEEAAIEITTTELPSVQFENLHVIQETPHVALRVLLLLPPWYELPWCAIHATIEEIRRKKLLARHALGCLSEIRLFLSGCCGTSMQRSNLNIREETNRFCRDQLILLVECAADPLIYNREKLKNLSNPQENQHLVLPLEIIPSILRLAMRIEPIQEHSNAQSSIVVELCDMLFCSSSYSSSNSLASTLIVPFLSLAVDCAAYLQDRHWYTVQQRVLYYLNPPDTSLHPQHYADLLRRCLGILSGIPVLKEKTCSSMLSSFEKSASALSEKSQTDFMSPGPDAKHRWEYVILQLYYAAFCLSKSDPSILPEMDMVFFSSLGHLPFSATMEILRCISWFVADVLQLSPKSQISTLSRNASAVDQDAMFCVCSNLTLLCLKSQDIPRRTFNLAASALDIGKGQIIKSSEEVVNTLLIIVHVKSILLEGKSILKDDPHGHQSYNDRLTATRQGPGAKERSVPLTQHMELFFIELTKLSTAFFFVSGGICRVDVKSCVPKDGTRGIESFSAFLSACANIVYQSVNIERDFNLNDNSYSTSYTYGRPDRAANWMLCAFSVLNAPSRNDSLHRYLLANTIITCIFLELPSSRHTIVCNIIKGLTQGHFDGVSSPFVFCSLCSIIVKSIINIREIRAMVPADQNDLQSVLEPIFNLLTSTNVTMEHNVRKTLASALLPMPSAREHILLLGRKLLGTQKLTPQNSAACNAHSSHAAALDILLGLTEGIQKFVSLDDLTNKAMPLDCDFCSLDAMLILHDIILFDKYSLQLSERVRLFRKLTDLAFNQNLSQFVALQILRFSLRKLLHFFMLNETPSFHVSRVSPQTMEKCETLTFVPAVCFADSTSKANINDPIEDFPGLLQMTLFLVAAYDEDKSDFYKEILIEALEVQKSVVIDKDFRFKEPPKHLDRRSAVSSIAASVCKALLSWLFCPSASCDLSDRKSDCLLYQKTLAAEFEFELKSVNLALKKRLSPTYIEKETSMSSFLASSHKMPKPTHAVMDHLRSSCLDVILCFLLSRDKVEAYADETQSSNELLIAIDGLLKAHDMPSNIDANSKIRIDSATSFFNLTKFSDTPFRYYYAVKYYCNTTQSEMLKDATTMEIGLINTISLMDSLSQMHHQAACMDRTSWLLFMDPEENSSTEQIDPEKDSSIVERFSTDIKWFIINALWSCFINLKKRLLLSNVSLDNLARVQPLTVFGKVDLGEGSGIKLPLALICRVCVDTKRTIDSESAEFLVAKCQLKCIDTALDVVALLLHSHNLTFDEIEEIDEFCKTLSTSLWSIACSCTISDCAVMKTTLRLLLVRVPLLRAGIRPSRSFFKVPLFCCSHSIVEATRQCFHRLKAWHKQERQGEWDQKLVRETHVTQNKALNFLTADVWSWCLECVLSALSQVLAFMGKSLRTESGNSKESVDNLMSQNSLLHGALNTKNDLECMIVIFCEILGSVEKAHNSQGYECSIYAELLSSRSKVLLSVVLDRLAQTIESATRYLCKLLDGSDSIAMVSTAAVNSIACIACLIDNSCVPYSAKDLAARTRKWLSAERKRAALLKKHAKLVFHVEDSSILSRLPKVLFRMEKYESSLQALLVVLRKAARAKLKLFSFYNIVFLNVVSNSDGVSQYRTTKTNHWTILRHLSQYISTSSESNDFGMAVILDNVSPDDDEAQNESKGMVLKEGECVGDNLFGPTTTKFITRKKRKRSHSLRGIWNMHRAPVPRSRNAAVDEWLQTESDFDGDTFADLEDFLVPG